MLPVLDAGVERSQVILTVSDLAVTFGTPEGPLRAVRGLSYTVRRRESLAIVGESGSGKSVTSMAVMGLLPRNATVTGSVRFGETELLGMSDKAMSHIRGRRLGMIFQDPMTSLDPVYKIGAQLGEALQAHDKNLSRQAIRARCVELLDIVGIPNAAQRLVAYPHEFSGGMRQRVVIAIAIANNPDVIIADEPTTALDVTVQAVVLEALQAAQEETGAALVLITHDLGVVARMADRVLVMYAGRAVEVGSAEDVFYRPRMPYTVGLLNSLPRIETGRRERLTPIHGSPPSLLRLPSGCPFAPRCPMAITECTLSEPSLDQVQTHGARLPATYLSTTHLAACIRSGELVGRDRAAAGRVFAADSADKDLPAESVSALDDSVKNVESARGEGRGGQPQPGQQNDSA